MRFFPKISILVVFAVAVASASCFAQAPSTAASDAWFMTVKTEFGNETFTIIKDGRIEGQFYFVPARPHVAVEYDDNERKPVFQLLTYQREIDGELKQGGILQLSLQTGISEKTQNKLLDKIKQNFPVSDKNVKYNLSPLPIKDSTINMYDLNGDFLVSAPVKKGIAPIFGNQQYPFMLNLTDLGADVMEALCRGKGGLPVLITYTFQGMTPSGGFTVEVNWDACYKHFSTDTKLKAQVAYANLAGSLGADFSTIREKLTSNSMIKVTSLSNEAMSSEQIDAVMEPILNLITKEMFAQIKMPEKVPPAVAGAIAPLKKKVNPTADTVKQVGQAIQELSSTAATAVPYVGTMQKIIDMIAKSKADFGASFALKDAKYVKKGKFTYTFDRQAIVERRTAFGGPIGIGSFDKEIQDECITVLPGGHWESAFFMIPPVGNPDHLGFNYITMTVTPMNGNRQISGMVSKLAIFNKDNQQSWKDRNGNEATKFLFPLKSVYASDAYESNPENFKFEVTTEVHTKNGKKIKTITEIPMFNGDLALAPVTELLKPVFISGDFLSFGEQSDEIVMVLGNLEAGRNSYRFRLTSDNMSQGFLVPSSEEDIKIKNMQFLSKTGKRVSWKNNGKDLKEVCPTLDLMLFDSDWQETTDNDSLSDSPF
ncbi:MAG: hypothetical protein ACQETH_05565 [Candidatus Rifleibacteriota bacterium]